jgi:YgiT-type zinc finger domain-containing protein
MTLLERVPSPFTRQAYGIPRTTLRSVPALDPDATLPILPQRAAAQPQAVLPMRCLSCQGPVQRATAPVSFSRGGYRLTWEAVPAWVCTRCSTPYFEPKEVEHIRQALQAVRGMTPKL